MKRLLAIDTSSDVCSVSLYHEGHWAHFHEAIPRQHANKVLGIIDTLLAEQSVAMETLDGIVYGQGPGSFTGLRIAAGVACGISLGLNLPLYAVSTLTALAMASPTTTPESIILPCIDARMNQVYWCPHRVDAQGLPVPLTDEVVCDPSAIAIDPNWIDCVALGNGWQYGAQMDQTLLQKLSQTHADLAPRASDMIRWVLSVKPQAQAPGVVEPVYIRNNVTWDQQPKIGS